MLLKWGLSSIQGDQKISALLIHIFLFAFELLEFIRLALATDLLMANRILFGITQLM